MIEPDSGAVTGWIDLAGLKSRMPQSRLLIIIGNACLRGMCCGRRSGRGGWFRRRLGVRRARSSSLANWQSAAARSRP